MDTFLIAGLVGVVLLYIVWGIFCWRLAATRSNNPEWLALEYEETDLMYQELTASRSR